MLDIPLRDLNEAHLQRLIDVGQSETLRIEFKQELILDKKKEKLEVAKDVSALANSAGGRLIYGVQERTLADGTLVAGGLTPLTDGTLVEKLCDVLNDNIFPSPKFQLHSIDASERGFYLVVEVPPSDGQDLHMVVGNGDNRFYRRTERRRKPMSEPEIREAYQRIAIRQIALDERLEREVEPRIRSNHLMFEIIIIVPLYLRKGLADPRSLDHIHREILEPIERCWRDRGTRPPPLRVTSGGLELKYSEVVGQVNTPMVSLEITKSGLVQLASNRATWVKTASVYWNTRESFLNMHSAISIARRILDKVAYWGPVRIVHHVGNSGNDGKGVCPPPRRHLNFKSQHPSFPPGFVTHEVGECTLRDLEQTAEPVLREIWDQIFHGMGMSRCPWFGDDGTLKSEYREELPEIFG